MKIWISLFAVLCFANLACAQAPAEYPDVPQGNPAYNDFHQLVQYGLVPDYYDYYRPVMTRYEFAVATAKIITKFYGRNNMCPERYCMDESYRAVFEKHPSVAASLVRLLTQFKPELQQLGVPIGQIQFAKNEIAARTGSTPSMKPLIAAPFRDVPKTHWAFDAVERLRQSGIVIGNLGGAFAK